MSGRYSLKRARSGRFNFTFASESGEIEGCVFVPIERRQSRAEIVAAAERQVEALLADLDTVTEAKRARPEKTSRDIAVAHDQARLDGGTSN